MRQDRLLRVAAATVAIFVCMVSAAARAETRALLVGVWQFKSKTIPDLKGPPNDLAAMEALVRAQGATDVTVLANENVTRASVETALHALGLRAKAGDWLLFYYSGHGAEAEAAVKGTSDGDRDQFVPLPGFDIDAPDPERYIVDKDFYAWIARYVAPSVEVLFIADACHSGTLFRSIDPRAWAFTPRLAFRGGGELIKLTARPAPRFPSVLRNSADPPAAAIQRADLPNEIYVGAAQDDQLALEASLPVEGAPSRGLLTWAFEQGLTTYGPDGRTLAADLNHDGVVTVGELAVYLDTQTRSLTGQRQEASVRFVSANADLALFKGVTATAARMTTASPRPAVFAADPAALAMLGGQTDWRLATAPEEADFVWDFPSGSILRRSGDVVARRITSLPALRGVLEKWRTVEALRPMMAEASGRLIVGPRRNGSRYEAGAKVDLTLTTPVTGQGAGPRFVTVFDLASDGTVQVLYPLAEDGEGRMPAGGALPVLATEAVEPFGADHVVALITPRRPDAFRDLLRTVGGSRGSARLVEPLRQELAAAAGQGALSVGELYTGS